MPFTVTMPKLSPTMEEGAIAKWHKKVGDAVKAGDLLVEVATDKATVEYNAVDDGILRKILVAEGGHAIVNQPIAVFTVKSSESIDGYVPEGEQPAQPTIAAKKLPETSAATNGEVKAPVSTAMLQQPAFVPEPPLENYTFSFPTGDTSKRIAASPLAKKLAKEKGLDLTSVKGTGPQGRVTSHDLSLAQPNLAAGRGRHEIPSVQPGTFEELPLSPMRKAIATRLQQSKSYIPHFYVRQKIDALALVELREQLKSGGVKVTINDFIVRAVALSLREHPSVNSGFNSVQQSIIRFKTVDVAVAVSVEAGLITPIIRHADYKTLGELSVEIKELATRAKAGKLAPEEYKGGSFTISNLGMFGVSDFIAILNPPQAAILSIAGIEECVRIKNGLAVGGQTMNITLSADHRVIDGAAAAQFIKTVQKYLEAPTLLLI